MPLTPPTLPIEERTGQNLESPSGSPGKRRSRPRGNARLYRAGSDIPSVENTPTPYADARLHPAAFPGFGGLPLTMMPPPLPFSQGYFPPMPLDGVMDQSDFPKDARPPMWPQTPTPGGSNVHMYNPGGFWLGTGPPGDRATQVTEATAQGLVPEPLGPLGLHPELHTAAPGAAPEESNSGGSRWNVREKNTFVHVDDADATPVGGGLQPKGQSMPDLPLQNPGRTTPSRSVGGPGSRPMQSIPEPVQEHLDDERLSIPPECPDGVPSRGSAIHGSGKCRPCAWFYKAQGCQNQEQCAYCHMCPEGELKQRKKAKVAAMRLGALEPANKDVSTSSVPRVLKLGPLLSQSCPS